MIKTLAAQVKQYKKPTIFTAIFTVLESIMETAIPYVAAFVIDRGIRAGDMSQILLYGGIMLLMAGLSLLFGILAGRMAATASTGYAKNLREAMYKNIQTFSFSNIDKFSTSGLVTRLTTDVTNVQNAYQMLFRMTLRAPINLITAITLTLIINTQIAGIYLVSLLFLVLVFSLIVKFGMGYFTQVFKKYDELNMTVQENVSAIRVVKAFVKEDYEKEKFGKANFNLYNLFVKAEKIISYNTPAMMLAMYGTIIALSWVGAQLIVSETITTGNLTSLLAYAMTILGSLMMLTMVFVMLTMSAAAGKRITEVLNEKPDIDNKENPIFDIKDGSIEFNNVMFRYNEHSEKPVLDKVNLKIGEGQLIGIIGNTGSGKTSFINLISRLYDVNSGSVKVGGVDVRDYDLETLRNNVAVVLQKNELFSGTILDNLRWGKETATEQECINVAKIACAEEFISRMPEKYNTHIERGGANVSGGQKQRLCIARALLKDPKVLILDDSTSAVDTATDAKIRKSFREDIPAVTKLIISQRISSIQDADKIIVIDDGEITGYGTHDELINTNSLYKSIYENQTQGDADFDEKDGE